MCRASEFSKEKFLNLQKLATCYESVIAAQIVSNEVCVVNIDGGFL